MFLLNKFKSSYFRVHCVQNCQKQISQFKRSPMLKLGDRNTSLINKILQSSPQQIDGSWKDMRNQILEFDKTINQINIDAIIISHLELEKAKSYVQFLNNEGVIVNLASLGRLLRLYYFAFDKNNSLPDEDLKDVSTM
jgi:hypothetical protein